ncbi:hypothetical protein Pyrde_1940 [Pyrodictium delaneyi]|uniref:Polysaccharide biosynthesis protein n=1 Tax=Pyrodictium delaneyi TaxID=1273541 RepID=A0A0P0N6B3_9CREN|nr:hypothetical protein [Pyrodictium delaneyi]ALL01983.1 hypothetical protein Pyrde_1940 [Pyrodictium delaneyi]
MGVLASTLIRGLLYAVALLVNAVASVVLVRRLGVQDYALYQTVMKRVTRYAAGLPGLYGLWLYRYTVQGVRGAAATGLLLSLASGLVAAVVGYSAAAQLGAQPGTALLAAFASAAMVVWTGVRVAVDAARPLRVAMAVLMQRLLYSILVLVLVYFMRLGVGGAFAAPAASYTAVTILGLLWLRSRGVLVWPGLRRVLGIAWEWMRRAYVTAIGNAAVVLHALDVVVAYALSSSGVVAAFFAITNIFMLVTEAARNSFVYLQGFVLSTRDYVSAANAVRIAALLASPLLVYAAVYPLHLVYLLNPVYSWAAPAAPIAAAASLTLMIAMGVFNLLAGLVEEDGRSGRRLAGLYSVLLVASAGYLVLLGAGLLLAGTRRGEAIAWALAFLARSLIILILLAVYAPQSIRSVLYRPLLWGLIVYPLLAVLAALVFPPRSAPSPRFWETFWAVAPSAAGALLLYVALVLFVDVWARGLARAALAKLRDRI